MNLSTSTSTTRSTLPRVLQFVRLERRVRDLERSVNFYVQGLGFQVQEWREESGAQREVMLSLGKECLLLIEINKGIGTDVAIVETSPGPDVRFQHAAIVTRDMSAALRQLEALTPTTITQGGPQQLPAASGGATAFKFRDPDGHPLELVQFATDRIPARWRQFYIADAANVANAVDVGPTTLGIDHAAISVSNIESSIRFYEGLGFTVGPRQINRGREQARLDGLDDIEGEVIAEVVSLMPSNSAGVHLELLAYRHPSPVGNAVDPLEAMTARLATADCLLWSDSSAVGAGSFKQDSKPDFQQDPDGHLFRILRLMP